VLAADKPDLADLKVTVNGSGSFVELLKATHNRRLLRSGSSAVNTKEAEEPVATGSVLTLDDLLVDRR